MKKNQKPTAANVEQPVAQPEPTQQPVAAPLPKDIVAQLKAAASPEDAVKLLQPDLKSKAKTTTVYEVVADCTEPLPKQRGACLLVYVTAARRDGTFTAKDIAEALPTVKSAAYWTRKLATSGHLREVE